MSLMRLILFISFFISIYSITFTFSFKNFFGDLRRLPYEEFVNNPYRILGLAPWTSFKKIKKKYTELVKKVHPDKSETGSREEFELIQQSFEKIKKERKEMEENEENDDISFFSVIRNTISKVLNIEIIFLAVYSVSYLIYKFQSMIYVQLFYMIISFTVIDNIFPHFFKEELFEYITCLIMGYLLYNRHKKYFGN